MVVQNLSVMFSPLITQIKVMPINISELLQQKQNEYLAYDKGKTKTIKLKYGFSQYVQVELHLKYVFLIKNWLSSSACHSLNHNHPPIMAAPATAFFWHFGVVCKQILKKQYGNI